jgi:hypothetical protein
MSRRFRWPCQGLILFVQWGLTPPSSGHPKAFRLWLPLMSNVRAQGVCLHLRIVASALPLVAVAAMADDHPPTEVEPAVQRGVVGSMAVSFHAGLKPNSAVTAGPIALPATALGVKSAEHSPSRLSAGIAAAAKVSLSELGISAASEAILECLKGDYPGGGMGPLSLPFARVSARTDHCRR